MPWAHSPLGEHPFDEFVPIGLGQLRQLLAAQPPPDRFQIVLVAFQRDSPNSASALQPLIACFVHRDIDRSHVAAFSDFRGDPTIFAAGLGQGAIGEPLTVAVAVRFGSYVDLEAVGHCAVPGSAFVDRFCTALLGRWFPIRHVGAPPGESCESAISVRVMRDR